MGNRKKSQPSYYSSGNLPFSANSSVTGRNLTKNQLGGVIFGCKHSTMRECLSTNLFGLPSGHFSYVKNIEPGLPLFLFNYSDRKLHGIFEAASRGKMLIDPYAWTSSDGGLDRTQFPAQVQIRVQRRFQPLSEDKFKPVIEDNYYTNDHFWFELDHVQASKLISLLTASPIPPDIPVPLSSLRVSPGIPVPQNKKWTTLFQSPSSHEPSRECEPFEMHESGLEYHSNHSIVRSDSTENDFSLNGYIQPLDSHMSDKEVKQDEKSLISIKLKELTLNQERQNLSLANDVKDTPDADANNICSMGKNLDSQVGLEKKEEGPSSPFEYPYTIAQVVQNVFDTQVGLEKEDGPSSPFEYPYNIAQLVQELLEFKNKQAETNYFMEEKLVEAQDEIQKLRDRCAILESACKIPVTHVEKTVNSSSAEMHFDPKDSLFLLGGYDGESWLATMDLYCTSQNVMRSLKPMSSVRSYASAVQFNGEIYVFGGGNDSVWYDTVESYNPVDNWTPRPSLSQKKGSLSGAALNNKIFAVGGGNGLDCFADVEMLDLDIGRWIPTRSMLDKRFALAAAELNGVLYATGGYDGNVYLKSAERFDPREHSWTKIASMNTKRGCHSLVVLNEKLYALGGFDGNSMIPDIEVFDPRLGAWMMGEPMSRPRGSFAAAVVKESIYVIGGVEDGQNFVCTVENYNECRGWEEIYTAAPMKRCYLSAVAYSHELQKVVQ